MLSFFVGREENCGVGRARRAFRPAAHHASVADVFQYSFSVVAFSLSSESSR